MTKAPKAKAPVEVTKGSRRVAALPLIPPIVSTMPCSFLSRHAVMNAARSMIRRRVRMPSTLGHDADHHERRAVDWLHDAVELGRSHHLEQRGLRVEVAGAAREERKETLTAFQKRLEDRLSLTSRINSRNSRRREGRAASGLTSTVPRAVRSQGVVGGRCHGFGDRLLRREGRL